MNNCQQLIVEKLVLKASDIYNLKPAELNENTKRRKCVLARQVVWTVCKYELMMSYRSIGQAFKMDCKTVHQGVRVVKNEMGLVTDRQKQYGQLKATVNETMIAEIF